MTRLRSDTSGFTLIELLIAIAVSSIVILAVSAAFVVDLLSTRDDQRAVSSAQDAAVTASLFARDVQSAASVSTTTSQCNAPGSLVVSLAWTQPVAQKVDYAYSAGVLTRVRCGSPADSVPVASQLTSAPTLSCSSSPCSTSSGLTLTLSEADGTSYPLTAYRRAALS